MENLTNRALVITSRNKVSLPVKNAYAFRLASEPQKKHPSPYGRAIRRHSDFFEEKIPPDIKSALRSGGWGKA